MLRVTIDLIPRGDESRKKTLATADIWNDGTGSVTTGNYGATLFVHQTADGKPKKWRTAFVNGFPRISRGPWDLLQLVLKDALKNRNNLQNVSSDDD